jgi:hypothetical protein
MNRKAKIDSIVAKHIELRAAINDMEYQELIAACKKAKLPHVQWFWKNYFVPIFKQMQKYKRETASTIFTACLVNAFQSENSDFSGRRREFKTKQTIAFTNLLNRSRGSWDSLYSACANIMGALEKEEATTGVKLSSEKIVIDKFATFCKIMRAAKVV